MIIVHEKVQQIKLARTIIIDHHKKIPNAGMTQWMHWLTKSQTRSATSDMHMHSITWPHYLTTISTLSSSKLVPTSYKVCHALLLMQGWLLNNVTIMECICISLVALLVCDFVSQCIHWVIPIHLLDCKSLYGDLFLSFFDVHEIINFSKTFLVHTCY